MSKEQGSESVVSGSQFIKKEEEMAEEKEAPKRVSRREFVKGAAAVAGAGALASCAPAATPAPGETAAPAPTCPPALPAGECPTAATPWLPETWDYEAEVVVVGYGGAGAAAAIAATDAGAKVLLLEKMPEGLEGGNTFASGGGATHAYDKELATQHIYGLNQGFTEVPVTSLEDCRDHVDQIAGLLDYYTHLGIGWDNIIHDYSHFFCTVGNTAGPGSPYQSGLDRWKPVWEDLADGVALFAGLKANVDERGIEVMYGTPAKTLIQDPVTKEILGVIAESGGQEVAIKAKRGVVMALGGIENNNWMVGQYLHPGFLTLTRGTPGNTGDGILMCTDVGAQMWHMVGDELYTTSVEPLVADYPGMGIPVSVKGDGGWIWSGAYGKRFGRENQGGHTKRRPQEFFDGYGDDPTAKCDYTNHPTYIIFDETGIQAGALGSGGFCGKKGLYEWSEDNSVEIESGLILKADTIEELALKCKAQPRNAAPFDPDGRMDPATLKETVTKHNQFCAGGEDLDFGRDPEDLIPIETPPFYAVEALRGFTNSQAGPKHNGKAQVVNSYDEAIPRLYAAGEFGSIYGFIYHGSGNVAEAVMIGKLAAENAAAETPWE